MPKKKSVITNHNEEVRNRVLELRKQVQDNNAQQEILEANARSLQVKADEFGRTAGTAEREADELYNQAMKFEPGDEVWIKGKIVKESMTETVFNEAHEDETDRDVTTHVDGYEVRLWSGETYDIAAINIERKT